MADLYLDHNSYPAWSLVPAWGVPQDGDGLLTSVSNASATASIDMASTVAVAGNTLSVMGAVLTCVASGATVNQFNAGSGEDLITNLVEAINRTTNTSPVAAQATNWVSTIPLNRVVFARKTGTNLEIMTRSGSTVYNGKTAIAWSGITGLTGPYTLGGGVSGCWNAYFNDLNMAASQFGTYSYGVLPRTVLAGPLPQEADSVICRANDKTLSVNTDFYPATLAYDIYVDNANEVWPDTLNKKLTIGVYGSTGNLRFIVDSSGRCSFRAALPYGLVFLLNTSANGSIGINTRYSNGTFFYENVKFHDNSTGTGSSINMASPGFVGGPKFCFYHCEFRMSRASNGYSLGGGPSGGLGSLTSFMFDDCDVIHDSLTSPHPGFFNLGGYSNSVRITNSRLTSGAVTPPFVKGYTTSGAIASIAFAENLTGFSLNSSTLGFSANSAIPMMATENCIAILQNIGPKKGYRYESNTQLIDWIPDSGYPTLTATMPDGTPWSLRSFWAGGTIVNSKGAIGTSVMLTKRAPVEANGVRTITMELLIETAAGPSITNSMLCLDVAYVDSSGAMRTQSTRKENWFSKTGLPISTSTASWSKNSYAGSHSAYKLSIVTEYPVKSGSDVISKLMMLSPCPVAAANIFVEPEIEIV